MEISCKHCGGCIGIVTPLTKGPHKNRVDCAACGKFYKWASDVSLQDFTPEQIKEAINKHEWKAIEFARAKDANNFFKETNTVDKLIGLL